MCPAALPVGAEPERRGAELGFAPAAACELVGLTPAELDRWGRAIAALRLAPSLTFADLLALAVVAEASHRLGARGRDFELGLCRLFVAMADQSNLERLDDHVALVGRDFARVARLRGDHISCAGDGFLVIPLGPILAGLRDRVFA
jgi:hypothetical protein